MKRNNLKAIVLAVVSAAIFLLPAPQARAAFDPGCYELSGGVFKEKNCPTAGYQKRVEQSGACFLIKDATSAEEKSCSDLTSEPTKTNGTGSNNNTSGRQVIDADCKAEILNKENCNIIKYLVNGINFLSALAGMAIIGSIMIAGYQYMTARDNSGQVEAAKKRILWAMIALGVFIFMYAFLNWVVPGGVVAV